MHSAHDLLTSLHSLLGKVTHILHLEKQAMPLDLSPVTALKTEIDEIITVADKVIALASKPDTSAEDQAALNTAVGDVKTSLDTLSAKLSAVIPAEPAPTEGDGSGQEQPAQ